ncbi:hypothetical protein TNCT_157981 [Trichonephila clavata]|uniref:Uncharacterized protein n=1 Tax=Trichonephila clavata TaxID=2740835 RepID=A0A8X6LXS7_TRICU|nr:hypothetical protein TNCT_157981 [Trichonephila clavata]
MSEIPFPTAPTALTIPSRKQDTPNHTRYPVSTSKKTLIGPLVSFRKAGVLYCSYNTSQFVRKSNLESFSSLNSLVSSILTAEKFPSAEGL